MGSSRSVRIRDVAERAGVSVGTVSHVLNRNASARISQSTQDRVFAVAEELGYRPNRLARSLWRGKTDTIGLLISGLRNPFFAEMVELAEELVRQSGFRVVPASGPSYRGTFRDHGDVFNWPVDGVIMWASAEQTLAQYMGPAAVNTPVVYIGSIRSDRTHWVGFDSHGGGRDLTRHLVDRGYRKIAYVSPCHWESPSREPRFEGYVEVCQEAGLSPRTLILEDGHETPTAGLRMGLNIASMPPSERPDAVFCHNDVVAMGVFGGLRRSGLRVPEDVAVAGFDGIEECQCLEVPITTVSISGKEIVTEALSMLNAQFNSPSQAPIRSCVLPTRLVPGGST